MLTKVKDPPLQTTIMKSIKVWQFAGCEDLRGFFEERNIEFLRRNHREQSNIGSSIGRICQGDRDGRMEKVEGMDEENCSRNGDESCANETV